MRPADKRSDLVNVLIEEAAQHWRFAAPLLKRPATDVEYDSLASPFGEHLALSRGDPDHEIAGLASAMGDSLVAYDEEHRPMPHVTRTAACRDPMQEHRMSPGDLPEIGTATAIEDVLSGRARIDTQQARALGLRFALPSNLFLAP